MGESLQMVGNLYVVSNFRMATKTLALLEGCRKLRKREDGEMCEMTCLRVVILRISLRFSVHSMWLDLVS